MGLGLLLLIFCGVLFYGIFCFFFPEKADKFRHSALDGFSRYYKSPMDVTVTRVLGAMLLIVIVCFVVWFLLRAVSPL